MNQIGSLIHHNASVDGKKTPSVEGSGYPQHWSLVREWEQSARRWILMSSPAFLVVVELKFAVCLHPGVWKVGKCCYH